MSALADLRTAAAGALEAGAPPEWSVLELPVDAVTPPAFMLTWAEPWGLNRSSFCRYAVELQVIAIAGRIDPDPGIELLEDLIEHALGALDTASLPPRAWTGPRSLQIGALTYLTATLTIPSTVTVGGI